MKTWTEDEVSILLANYNKVSNTTLGQMIPGKTPLAIGSNVPVCPTFSFAIFLTIATISCEVYSFGLSINKIPFIYLTGPLFQRTWKL